jgi:hypothetical protein
MKEYIVKDEEGNEYTFVIKMPIPYETIKKAMNAIYKDNVDMISGGDVVLVECLDHELSTKDDYNNPIVLMEPNLRIAADMACSGLIKFYSAELKKS